MDRALAKEKARETFNQAIDIIINKLGLANIALSIFSERNIVYIYDEPPIMALCLVGGKRYLWKINAENCATMHPNEIAWVIIHECLHYILRHIEMWPLFRNKHSANIAADLIVNDLAAEVLRDIVDESFFDTFKYEFYTGPNTLGMITCDMALEEVYKKVMLLPQPPEDLPNQLDNHDQHNPEAPGLEEVGQELGKMFTESPEDKLYGKGDDKQAPLSQEEVNRKSAGYGQIRGDGQLVGMARAIFNFNKIFIKLTGKKLLRGSDDDINNTWIRRPRATISIDPANGVLPGTMMGPQKKSIIDLFIDISGSISPEQCSFFANFVNLIPRNKWEVRIHSFNTEVFSDIEINDKGKIVNLKAGGGTSFDAVARFVLTERPSPDNIVIVTDGEDVLNKSLISNPEKWSWIIDTDNSRFLEIKETLIGRIFQMKDITKEMTK